MSKYMRYACGPAVAFTLILAACSGEKRDNLAQDSTLNRDIDLAATDTSAVPALQDQPPAAVAPAPAAPKPAAKPAPKPATKPTTGNKVVPSAGKETLGTIPAGSTLNLASSSTICTNTNKVGDRVSATVTQAVTGSNGSVIPVGATVSLEVTELKRSENARDDIRMGFAVRSVTFGGHTYNVPGTVTYAAVTEVKNQPKSKDAQKVATGAAVGAVLGQVLGKNTKSTVIGGAIGAAAGAGTAAATANKEGCVNDGARITVTLSDGVQVRI